jgi:hypothetical protein
MDDLLVVCPSCGVHPDAARQSGVPPQGASTSNLAIAGLITVFFASPVGLILGYLARSEIRKSNGTKTGLKLTTATLILGWIFVAILGAGLTYQLVTLPVSDSEACSRSAAHIVTASEAVVAYGTGLTEENKSDRVTTFLQAVGPEVDALRGIRTGNSEIEAGIEAVASSYDRLSGAAVAYAAGLGDRQLVSDQAPGLTAGSLLLTSACL